MYRDAQARLDERDPAVGAILIGEALIASCEHAQRLGAMAAVETPEVWRAMRDAYDSFPEIWLSLDRGRDALVRRGFNVIGYDELRPRVRTRLATVTDAGEVRIDPKAVDDARRATDELKLAAGADWSAIEQRTRGLVDAPLTRRRRNRVILAGTALVFLVTVLAWFLSLVPRHRPDRGDALRHELAQIAELRRIKIVALQGALHDRCDVGLARELTRQLVMDGRGLDARGFAADYATRCEEDEVIGHWANAPLP